MARFRVSSLFSNGTGKLGENVVSKGRDGYVGVRPRVTPANPQSEGQMRVRDAQTESSQAWDTLTEDQAQNWRSYAATLPQKSNKTGLPIKKQGFNVFCSMYDRFRLANATGVFPKNPPATRFVPDPIVLSLDASGPGTQQIKASQASSAGQTVEILAQRLAGKNRLPQPNGYRTQMYFAFTAAGQSLGFSLAPGYWSFAYRVVSTLDGAAGPLKTIGTSLVTLSMVQGGADEAYTPQKKAA